MAASKVPKFGAWEEGENYTVYFDKARKTKTNGQILTPNDPEFYSEMFQQNGNLAQAKAQKTNAPKFGDWENEDNVGYTGYFENPRRTKIGNPTLSENEPKMNRDIHPRRDQPAQARPAASRPEPQQEARSKVPQFGEWEAEGGVGYTQSFENVRKNNKNGRTVNPEPYDAPKFNRDVSEPPAKEGRSKVPQFGAWNGGEDAQYTVCFDNARKNKAGAVLDQVEPQLNRDVSDRARPGHLRNASKESYASETASRHSKQNTGVQYQKGAKLQQRPAAGRGNQTTERTAAVPAWGVWNTDPQQAEGFTGAFRRAKEERDTPLNHNIPPRYHQQSPRQKPKEGCCFGWF